MLSGTDCRIFRTGRRRVSHVPNIELIVGFLTHYLKSTCMDTQARIDDSIDSRARARCTTLYIDLHVPVVEICTGKSSKHRRLDLFDDAGVPAGRLATNAAGPGPVCRVVFRFSSPTRTTGPYRERACQSIKDKREEKCAPISAKGRASAHSTPSRGYCSP